MRLLVTCLTYRGSDTAASEVVEQHGLQALPAGDDLYSAQSAGRAASTTRTELAGGHYRLQLGHRNLPSGRNTQATAESRSLQKLVAISKLFCNLVLGPHQCLICLHPLRLRFSKLCVNIVRYKTITCLLTSSVNFYIAVTNSSDIYCTKNQTNETQPQRVFSGRFMQIKPNQTRQQFVYIGKGCCSLSTEAIDGVLE